MPDPRPTIPTPPPIPDRVVLGTNGAYWRDFSDGFYSMCPNSDDNDPVEPVAVFVLAARLEAAERDLADARKAMEFLANETLFGSIVAEYAQKKIAAAQQPPAEGSDG